jgi:hypothetical protein
MHRLCTTSATKILSILCLTGRIPCKVLVIVFRSPVKASIDFAVIAQHYARRAGTRVRIRKRGGAATTQFMTGTHAQPP